jgi:hypothetical protein
MPIEFQRSPQTIPVRWSASHLPNNLALYRSVERRRPFIVGIAHKSGFGMVSKHLE